MFSFVKRLFKNSGALSQVQPERDESAGYAIPSIGIIGEDESSVTLDWDWLEETTDSFDYDDETTLLNDEIITSRLDKLLSDAQTFKEEFIWENVDDDMSTFITNLNATLDWQAFNRYIFKAVSRRYSVIQLLWRNVDYELLYG